MPQLPLRTQILKALKRPLLPVRGGLRKALRRWKRKRAAYLRKLTNESNFPKGGIPSIGAATKDSARADLPIRVLVDPPSAIHFYPSRAVHETGMLPYIRDTLHQEPATFVASIPDGRVWGSCAAVISPDGFLVEDLSKQMEPASILTHRIFERVQLPPVDRIEATVAVLLTEGSANYFHWMCEAAPRYGLLQEAFPHASVDFYAVPKPLLKFHREVLAKLGVAEEKLLLVDDSVHIQARRLLVPSISGGGCATARACRFLRELFPRVNTRPPSRRIYISRKSSIYRRVIDEDTLIAFLSSYGFEAVALEGKSVAEQAAVFAEAEVVVGPHGAGMTNLIFCTPGSAVIELFSPYYVNPCYWTIPHEVGLKHFHLAGGENHSERGFDPEMGEVDIEVNYSELKALLKKAGIDPR